MNMFKPAVKHESKLRLAIVGPSGSGKTYTSLAVATALANGGKVAVVDTEHGSAEKYSGAFAFDVLQLDAPFHPDRFSDAIQMAAQAGYSVVVLDSLSHAWNGAGGALELVEQFSRKYKGNSYAAWGDVTPIQNRLIESIVGAKLHVIATMRSKQDYILVERNGKQMPQKVGMAPIQRDGFEYEFDVFLDMDVENNAVVTKTRCSELTGKVINRPGVELANTLRSWLSGEPMPEVKSQPTRPTTTNGNGHKPAPVVQPVEADELFPVIPESLKRKFHAVGFRAYGDLWDDKRAELVSTITKGATSSSNDLTREQLEKLIDGMEKKVNQQLLAVAEPMADPGYSD